MELWIRSQNKEILKKAPVGLLIKKDMENNNKENKYFIVSGSDELGTYKTKERAFEVLDEIQNKIAQNQSLISLMNNFTDLKGNEEAISELFKDMIYKMPKE